MSSTGTTMLSSISLVLGGAAMVTGRAPPRNDATSSAGRTVADRPIRWAGRRPVVSASSRSRDRARCAPRLFPARACTSSTITVSTPRSASRAFEVSSRNSDSGVVIRMSGGLVGQPAALLGGGVPGPHRDLDVGLGGAHGLRGVPDPGQRGAQVPLDVHRERLQRGDVQHPAAELRVLRGGGDGQPVQRPQEGGQRLARPGRRDDQGVLTLADRGPGLRLGRGGGGERRAEPVAGDGAEALERVSLASFGRSRRWCGLAGCRMTGHRYMVHGHTDRNKRPAQCADSRPAGRLVPAPPRGLGSADPQRKPHPGEERTDPTSGPEVLRTVQTTVRSPADQAPASG